MFFCKDSATAQSCIMHLVDNGSFGTYCLFIEHSYICIYKNFDENNHQWVGEAPIIDKLFLYTEFVLYFDSKLMLNNLLVLKIP